MKVYYPGLSQSCRELAAALLPDLITVAREHGYALAIHGSVARDIDLVAVPWTGAAFTAEELVAALVAAALRVSPTGMAFIAPERIETPTLKPHGRLCWSIHLGRGVYIDLSVMPISRPAAGT